MSYGNRSNARRGKLAALAGCAGLGLMCLSVQPLIGSPGGPGAIIRVEEDWEIELTEPTGDLDVPQFHTVMSPYGSINATYFQITWNYRENPDFVSGGLQLQVWNGEESFAVRNVDDGSLSNDAESVTWTQSLALDHHDLTFAVSNGHSSSWGNFGGESMTVRMPRPVWTLSGYETDISAANSWITYGQNRVVRIVLREVREYDEDGMVAHVTTPRVVYEQPSPE